MSQGWEGLGGAPAAWVLPRRPARLMAQRAPIIFLFPSQTPILGVPFMERETPRKVVTRRPRKIVFVERTRCPTCGSDRIKTHRSTREQDGAVWRRATCETCGEWLTVVVE